MEFTADELKKFWSHVDKTGDEGCWNWKGHKKSSKYYGIFHYRKKTPGAHRISYAIHHNEDISDKHIHHICENRGCVNPDHLEALLPIDHMRKTPQSNAYCALTTNTCIHGHAFIGDNVYYYPNGSRACRECIRRLVLQRHLSCSSVPRRVRSRPTKLPLAGRSPVRTSKCRCSTRQRLASEKV